MNQMMRGASGAAREPMRMVGLLGGGYAAFQQKLAAMAAAELDAAAPERFGGQGYPTVPGGGGEPVRGQQSGQEYAVGFDDRMQHETAQPQRLAPVRSLTATVDGAPGMGPGALRSDGSPAGAGPYRTLGPSAGSKLKVVYSDNQRPVSPAQAQTYQRLSEQGVFDPKAPQGSPTHPLAEREGFKQPPGTSMVRYQDGRIVYLPTQADWERESEHFTRHVDADVQRFGSVPYGSESLVEGVLAERGRPGTQSGGIPASAHRYEALTPPDPVTEKYCRAIEGMSLGGKVSDVAFGGVEAAMRAANGGHVPDLAGRVLGASGQSFGIAEEVLRARAEMRQGTSWKGALAGSATRMGLDAAGGFVGSRLGAVGLGLISGGNPVAAGVGGVVGGVGVPLWLDQSGIKDAAGDIVAGYVEGRRPWQCP